MHISNGFRHLLSMSTVALLIANGVALAQQSGSGPAGATGKSDLRWTPHRAATSPESAAAAEAQPTATAPRTDPAASPLTVPASVPATVTAAPAPAAVTQPQLPPAAVTQPQLPPATVGLPAGVPAVNQAPRRQMATRPPAPAQTRPAAGRIGDWSSDNRLPGQFRSSAGTDGKMSLPGLDSFKVFRSPQGDAGRPVLAAEGAPRRSPAGPAAAPVSGGLAPRFNPTANLSTGPRRERLAMNADGLPSVMTRDPQAAALGDAIAPGRLPAASGMPTQTLPGPRTSDSSVMGMDPSIVVDTMPSEMGNSPDGYAEGEYDPAMASAGDGMWMGEYPNQLHVESFYDDPYACEESDGFLTMCPHDGRVCGWLRQFGKPYYGWRWYRDFTAGAGITSFQNQSNFGLLGNYGTDEYLNWAMPFWNAFGLGWQLGVRGVQTNFQQPTLNDSVGAFKANSRQQVFVTTGFFTRAFEGRGLQGGAVYDYQSDSYFENVDVAQIRGEMSYVWGYHELGFWGAFNAMEQQGQFSPITKTPGVASTVDLYTAFYRLHFGDANEARIWGGASGNAQGVVGTSIRAPMSRSLAMEGNFTYLLPDKSQTIALNPATSVTFAPSAWNLSVNLVYYPAGRARRSLASPYRPLFDVADNGNMIRSLAR